MTIKKVWTCCAICAVGFFFHAAQVSAHSNSNEAGNPQQSQNSSSAQKNLDAEQTPDAKERDGQHDFDPLIGAWKYHLKRRLNPLTGSNAWVEFDGTGVCRKVWDGASLD